MKFILGVDVVKKHRARFIKSFLEAALFKVLPNLEKI